MTPDIAQHTLPLEDIIAPNGVSIWPLSLGWWLLLLALIGLAIAGIILYTKYKKKWAYRKQALNLLDNRQSPIDDKDAISHYLKCLKRTAISAYPTHNVQILYGRDWLDFLNRQTPTALFSEELADFICQSQYQKTITIDRQQLYKAVKTWIKKHATQLQINAINSDKEVA